jgi:hypothetical protein
MDQCERRLQDARTARDGDRAEQASAMAAANAHTAELQKTLQQLQVSRRYERAWNDVNINACFSGKAAAGGAIAGQLQKRS